MVTQRGEGGLDAAVVEANKILDPAGYAPPVDDEELARMLRNTVAAFGAAEGARALAEKRSKALQVLKDLDAKAVDSRDKTTKAARQYNEDMLAFQEELKKRNPAPDIGAAATKVAKELHPSGSASEPAHARVRVVNPLTITIIRQPEDREVVEGGETTLSIEATGPGPLTYQWWDGKDVTGHDPAFVFRARRVLWDGLREKDETRTLRCLVVCLETGESVFSRPIKVVIHPKPAEAPAPTVS